MSERTPNPREFNPSGWHHSEPIVDAMTEQGLLPRLSDEEVGRLCEGNGVQNPAVMRQFSTISEFRQALAERHNFQLPFQDPEGSTMWLLSRRRPAFQRYELLHDEEVAELDRVFEDPKSDPAAREQLLYAAYQRMAELVSQDDPYVMTPTGEVVDDYLLQ